MCYYILRRSQGDPLQTDFKRQTRLHWDNSLSIGIWVKWISVPVAAKLLLNKSYFFHWSLKWLLRCFLCEVICPWWRFIVRYLLDSNQQQIKNRTGSQNWQHRFPKMFFRRTWQLTNFLKIPFMLTIQKQNNCYCTQNRTKLYTIKTFSKERILSISSTNYGILLYPINFRDDLSYICQCRPSTDLFTKSIYPVFLRLTISTIPPNTHH